MTGFRGEPCEDLYVLCHVKSGKTYPMCYHSENEFPLQSEWCPVGRYCPLVGDKKYHIVQEMIR